MDLEIQNRVALVSGSSRGIGRAIALGLAREGCRLVLCARGETDLDEAVDQVHAAGAEVLGLAIDLTSPGAPEELIGKCVDRFGALDIVVNNAGGNRRKPFEETTDEDWQAIFDLNLNAHLRLTRAAFPHLKTSAGGAVVFISSIFGREAGGAGLSIYNTTKSALISAAKIMAIEWAPAGIRVNCVAPGSIRFPGGSWDRRCRQDPEGMAAFVEREIPIGRFGTAEEIADVVCFLCSRRASLVTGACLNVDGGQSRSLI